MSAWKQKTTSTGEGDFPKAPAGNHPAILIGIIDMGMQETEFQGVKKAQHRAYFCWELVQEKVPGTNDKNFVIGIDMTLSLNEKSKLRQWLESWRGKKYNEGEEIDISKVIGQPCLLSVTEKNGWPRVSGVAAVPKGMKVDKPQNTPVLWSIDDIGPDGSIKIPGWLPYLFGEPLTEHIKRRVQHTEKVNGAAVAAHAGQYAQQGDAAEDPDTIPF